MATITITPTGGTLTANKNKQVTGTISWSKPTIPSGATISSCVLTGKATATMSKGSVTITVNGTSVTSGSTFTINLGTDNSTTSVTTSIKGANNQASGSVSFSELLYTVTYTEPVAKPTYTVTFKDWDGTTLKTQTVEEGNAATAPSNPTKDGYDFTGWDKTFTNITTNTTITAQYSIKTYTVTFKDDDGSTLKTQTVNHGSAATAPSDPSKEGYTFTGWDKIFNNITSDLTVIAQYTKNEASEPETPEGAIPVEKTIALRPISATQDSGYNNTWTNIANTYDTDTSTSGTIVVTGSSQSGFKRKYVDTIFNFDNPIPANATINSAVLTIRAKQSATTNLNITVSIDSQEVIGSTLLSSSSANYTADVSNYIKDLNQLNINLTSAATSNRTFTLYDVRVDVNYTIYEMLTTYTVTFKDWNGTTLKTETVEEGASATAPNNPSREGYTFTGWDKDFTNITSDLTVTAQYEIINVPSDPDPENAKQLRLCGEIVSNLYIGGVDVKKLYLGDILIFENQLD